MPVVSLKPIGEKVEFFRFGFVAAGSVHAIDFLDGDGAVLLHISFRSDVGQVVLNSCHSGVWENEIAHAWVSDGAATAAEFKLRIKGQALEAIMDSRILWQGTWRYDLRRAQNIVLSGGDIHVTRGATGQAILDSAASLSGDIAGLGTARSRLRGKKKSAQASSGDTAEPIDVADQAGFRLGVLMRMDPTQQLSTVEHVLPQLDRLLVFGPTSQALEKHLGAMPNVVLHPGIEPQSAADLLTLVEAPTDQEVFALPFASDVTYPTDYVDHLTRAAIAAGAPVGVEGLFLRSDRVGGRLGDLQHLMDVDAALPSLRRVHALGLSSMCLPLRLLGDLPLPGSRSPLGFARHCAARGVALYAVPRRSGWMTRRTVPLPVVTSNIDSVLAVEIVHLAPRLKGVLPKVIVAVKTYNRAHYLAECIASMTRTLANETGFDISIVVADDGSSDGTLDALAELSLPFECHVIENRRTYAPGQFNSILQVFQSRRADFLIVVDDDLVFKKPGWVAAYYNAAISSGYHHLCHFNLPHFQQLTANRNEPFPPPAMQHSRLPLVAYTSVEKCMGALFTLTPAVLRDVGFADERNFAVRGLWHVDYSARACRAGYNEYARFFDIAEAHEYVELQNTLKQRYVTSIAWHSNDFLRVSTKEERARRLQVVRMRDRVLVPLATARRGSVIDPPAVSEIVVRLGDLFDCVFVCGAPDGCAARAVASLGTPPRIMTPRTVVGVEAAARLASLAADGIGDSLSETALFREALCAERIAQGILAACGNKSQLLDLNWALAEFFREALIEAAYLGQSKILLLDGEARLHRDFERRFDDLAADLPHNWRMLLLGADLAPGCTPLPYSKTLELNPGGTAGGYAVALQGEAIFAALDILETDLLPADLGLLNKLARLWPDASFIAKPGLVAPAAGMPLDATLAVIGALGRLPVDMETFV